MAKFITCYDKNLQEVAEFLKILVSNNDSINNLDFNLVQFKNQEIVSKEYVLYIGKKSVNKKSKMFKDAYNKYGIHIGYYGKNAWVYCEDFNWTEESYYNLKKDLITILKDLDLNDKDIDDDIAKQVENVKNGEDWESVVNSCKNNEERIRSACVWMAFSITPAMNLFAPPLWILEWVIKKIKNYFSKEEKRKHQYLLAIVIFYRFYLNELLNIKEDSNDNAMEDTEDNKDTEDSKKKTLETE